MKNTKRTIRTLLIIAIFTAFFSAVRVSAASGLNRKSAVITAGKTVQLTVADKGKATWSSSRKEVAAVSSKGKVTGKKAGTATVSVTVGKKKYSCKITVKAKEAASSMKIEKTDEAITLNNQSTLVLDQNTNGMSAEEAKVYRTIMAKKKSFPEGMKWTNANYYAWNGGIYRGGYGCAGLAFLLSDAAFGNRPAVQHMNFGSIKVGDIVRMEYNTHSVIVLKIVGSTAVVAEGNFDGKVHWGRTISLSEIRATGTYVITRY